MMERRAGLFFLNEMVHLESIGDDLLWRIQRPSVAAGMASETETPYRGHPHGRGLNLHHLLGAS